MPTTEPKSYAQVLFDLIWWGGGLVAFIVYVLPYLLPSDVRATLAELAGTLPTKGVLEPAVVGGFVSVVLVFLLKIHDVYDRRVIGWRDAYDLDFIIPTLVAPFRAHVHPEFAVRVRGDGHRNAMNKLFYHFVRDGKPLISENLVARFYYRILRYWLLVLNEIACWVVGAIALVSVAYGRLADVEATGSLVGLAATILVALVNRKAMQMARSSVKRATEEEIEAIHEDHITELEARLEKLHEALGLTYTRAT